MAVVVNPHILSAGAPAASSYRITYTADNGGSSVSIAEIEMYATHGGADECVGGTASAISGTAANAFDNSGATSWIGPDNAGWIRYDFLTDVTVAAIKIDYSGSGSQTLRDFVVERSTNGGGSWATVATFTSVPAVATDVYLVIVPPPKALRLRYTSDNGGSSVRIAEMEYRATVSGPDQCVGGFAVDQNYLINTGAFANDANTTAWVGPDNAGWLAYGFAAGFTLAEVSITIGATASQSPNNFVIEESTDFINWSAVITRTGVTWSANGTQLFTPP